MKRDIVLHGHLREAFGGPFHLEVATPAEAVRALCVLLEGFPGKLREGSYRLVRGPLEGGLELGEDQLTLGLGRAGELHLVPELAGGKRGGLGKVILGVALIGVAFAAAPAAGLGETAFSVFGEAVTFGRIALTGAALALGGVAQLLTPAPKVRDFSAAERPDQRPSFLFNGPVNVAEQGLPVPLVYGQARAGSVVVSAGISTEEI